MRAATQLTLACALSGAVALSMSTAAQDQPTFRAGTTLVEVSAVVTANGLPVTDLTIDDIRVLDNGVAQDVVAFEYVDLTRVEGPAQRRDFVLVVDDLHISPEFTSQAREVASLLVQALAPHDRLGLVTTGPHQIVVDLTADRAPIDAAIGQLYGQQPSGSPAPFEAELRTRKAFDVISRVAAGLQGDAAERRTLVLVSEGHRPMSQGAWRLSDDPAVLARYRDVIRDASLANVVVYAIDPRGLMASVPNGTRRPGIVAATASTMSASVGTTADSMAQRRFGSLGTIAAHTGGTLTVDTNDLGADIPRMIRDSRQYYRLAYVQPEPAAGKKQPQARRIELKVERRGVDVRARQQYVPRREEG